MVIVFEFESLYSANSRWEELNVPLHWALISILPNFENPVVTCC